MNELPEGWITVPISDVTQDVVSVAPENEPERTWGYVDISAIDNTRFQVVQSAVRRFSGREAPSRARRPIEPHDVLFSNVRTYLRNIALVPEALDAQLCSTGFTVLRTTAAMDPRFLFRYVLTEDFVESVSELQTGTHYPATSDRAVRARAIPLPPLAEQQRIVAKIEELLAQVNSAREHLDRVPAILKRFRQSVLAAACSGRLTEGWRQQHQDVEPASVLLERIWADRRKRMANDGAKKPKSGTMGNKPEVTAALQEFSDLPERWEWAIWNDLADWITYGFTRPMPHVESGIPIVTAKNVVGGAIDFSSVDFTTEAAFEALSAKDIPMRGEILLTKDGSIGRAAVVSDGQRFCINQSVAVIRFGGLSADPGYLTRVIESKFTQDRIEEESKGSAIRHISITTFGTLPVPLPPLEEQQEIARRVDALFRLAERVEQQVVRAASQAERLTQSILAKAFRGELVPTEAELAAKDGREYEPASVLLERIRREHDTGAERVARPPKRRRAAVTQ